jgi:hypothetical protein
MSTRLRIQLLTVLCLVVFGCEGAGNKDEGADDPHAEQVDSCVTNCLMPLCSGNITPSPDYETVCRSQCEDRVGQAEDEACFQEYGALLACIEETSCEMYYLWYDQEPNAPCSDLEAEFVSLCPSIDVRDSD